AGEARTTGLHANANTARRHGGRWDVLQVGEFWPTIGSAYNGLHEKAPSMTTYFPVLRKRILFASSSHIGDFNRTFRLTLSIILSSMLSNARLPLHQETVNGRDLGTASGRRINAVAGYGSHLDRETLRPARA